MKCSLLVSAAMLLMTPASALAQGALQALGTLSPNQGAYANVVPALAPDVDYTEVCFKAGGFRFDIHSAGETTAGGTCEPGDIGWIIERVARPEADWTTAKSTCLMVGMRLPEPFEFQFGCFEAATLDLVDMEFASEWTSNHAYFLPPTSGDSHGVVVPTIGGGSCVHSTFGRVASSDETAGTHTFRCVK